MLRAIMYFLLWKWEKNKLGTPMANTRQGQGYLASSPSLSPVPKHLSVWARCRMPFSSSYKCLACFRQQEIWFNPFHSYDFTAPAGKPSGKAANAAVMLFTERGGVSREGSWRFCNAQNDGSHIPLPTASGHQVLMAASVHLGVGFYIKMVWGCSNQTPKGVCHPQGSLP